MPSHHDFSALPSVLKAMELAHQDLKLSQMYFLSLVIFLRCLVMVMKSWLAWMVGISRVIAVIICMEAFGNWLAGGLWRSLER